MQLKLQRLQLSFRQAHFELPLVSRRAVVMKYQLLVPVGGVGGDRACDDQQQHLGAFVQKRYACSSTGNKRTLDYRQLPEQGKKCHEATILRDSKRRHRRRLASRRSDRTRGENDEVQQEDRCL